VKIIVKFTAQLKKEAGISKMEFKIDEQDSLLNIITKVAKSFNDNFYDMLLDEKGKFRQSIMLVFNGTQVGLYDPINFKEGDEILLMSPIAGG
jgi:molybdopterin converting factor small subunit